MSSATEQQTFATHSGAMCGGLIRESEFTKATKKDVWAYAMCLVMPDDWFEVYARVKELGDHKLASKIAEKYSWSVI